MPGNPPRFVGFEKPPYDINGHTWYERCMALYESHTGQWAKYGPYTSIKTLSNTKVKLMNKIQNQIPEGIVIDVAIKDEFLYVKVS